MGYAGVCLTGGVDFTAAGVYYNGLDCAEAGGAGFASGVLGLSEGADSTGLTSYGGF